MNVTRMIRIIAGLFIMLSIAMAHYSGQIDFAQTKWLWFTAFVGANLFQSGITKFCLLANILKALGLKE